MAPPTRVTFRGETRRALATPLPSRVSFDVTVPADAALRFAIGVDTREQPTLLVPVAFSVLVHADGRDESVFSETVRRSQPNRWLSREVDLSPWAGRSVQLSFESARVVDERPTAAEHVLPLWGNPALVDRAGVPPTPHIVLISIDCVRADHLSTYGYEHETSPNLDRFANEAVAFENAVAASSYTLPTHASMLTGLPPSLHGARVRKAISPSVPYVPAALAGGGYRTSAVVAAAFLGQRYGFDRGFHTYRVTGGRAKAIVDRALSVVDEGTGHPQFFFLHLYDAHAPYAAPVEFIRRFAGDEVDATDANRRVFGGAQPGSDAEVEHAVMLYDAEIAYIDHELGRFFEELKSRGLYDDALIIVTSDHGEAFQEHGAWQHGRAASLDKPGLYEEILHVPLIVKWPRETESKRVARVVSQLDIAPTILDAAGLESTSSWAIGLRSQLGADDGTDARTTLAEVATLHPEHGAGLQVMVRQRERKYIASFRALTLNELYESRPVREELYDLSSDPGEATNLMAEGVELGTLRAELRNYLKAARTLSPDDSVDVVLDDETLEELRALGYIDP